MDNIKTLAANLAADLPAYVSIAWIQFADAISIPDYPLWERFLLNHGWLILLTMRLVNAGYDWKARKKLMEEIEGPEKRSHKRQSMWRKFVNKIDKFLSL